MEPERPWKKGFVEQDWIEMQGKWQKVRAKMGTVMHKVNQEESEQNEVDGINKEAGFTAKVMHI